MRRTPSPLLACAGAVLLLGLGACTTQASAVDAATLEERVSEGITGEDADSLTVECPDDLEAEVDATSDCVVEDADGGRTGVRFTTTDVDDEVSYELSPFLEPETLETTLAAQLEEQGFAVEEVDCPDELGGETGSTTECTAVSQGEEGTVELETTDLDGLKVGFSWKVVD